MFQLPQHLQKYVVTQNYEKYTPVDQACWRFILRQLRHFLGQHAHECYLEGLEKTGINVETIPRIETVSKQLEKFGWRALPVSGFIPPAAFMELQSLGVLPIASDMRTLDHLLYTPAPDIVHEAAGHAPILVNKDFSEYLKQYAQVAKKAIISKEDLDLYEAIRKLSDLKESPDSTPEQIKEAQEHLNTVSKNITHVSEASELSRMNWWTAEYGLIGDIKKPKLFGAGLLSSVGESRWCLSDSVRKIPLTIDCIKTSYDITEPQPQLFVTPDFKTLSKVLEQMANKMAFRTGGLEGLNKAIKAATLNTAEFNSGIQISGQIIEVLVDENRKLPVYLRVQGPSQLSYDDQQLPGHGKNYHQHGFGTPVGYFKARPDLCPSLLSDDDLDHLGLKPSQRCTLDFISGVRVDGILKKITRADGKLILLSFDQCKVSYFGRVLFEPAWGTFDMAVGSSVTSVFGGPADRTAYGETDDFVAARVPAHQYTAKEKNLHAHYQKMRDLRQSQVKGSSLLTQLETLLKQHQEQFPEDWLLWVEALELVYHESKADNLKQKIHDHLQVIMAKYPNKKDVIQDGIDLANSLY